MVFKYILIYLVAMQYSACCEAKISYACKYEERKTAHLGFAFLDGRWIHLLFCNLKLNSKIYTFEKADLGLTKPEVRVAPIDN